MYKIWECQKSSTFRSVYYIFHKLHKNVSSDYNCALLGIIEVFNNYLYNISCSHKALKLNNSLVIVSSSLRVFFSYLKSYNNRLARKRSEYLHNYKWHTFCWRYRWIMELKMLFADNWTGRDISRGNRRGCTTNRVKFVLFLAKLIYNCLYCVLAVSFSG